MGNFKRRQSKNLFFSHQERAVISEDEKSLFFPSALFVSRHRSYISLGRIRLEKKLVYILILSFMQSCQRYSNKRNPSHPGTRI